MTPAERQEFDRLKRQVDSLSKMLNEAWAHLFPNKIGSEPSTAFELVALTIDGGTGGDESTPCDYTYGFTLSDSSTQAAVVPVQNRLPTALAATFGLWDTENEQLIALDEWPDGGPCS